MKINIVYKKEKEWFVGHVQEYPEYESQGKTLEELKSNLMEIYGDITKGLVPDAEPFQVLEVAIWKEKSNLESFMQWVVFLCVMVGTMTGIRILKRVGLNPFQGTMKLKMALLNELLRDCHRDLFNNRIVLTGDSRLMF